MCRNVRMRSNRVTRFQLSFSICAAQEMTCPLQKDLPCQAGAKPSSADACLGTYKVTAIYAAQGAVWQLPRVTLL